MHVANNLEGFDGPAAARNLTIRVDRINIGHGPKRLRHFVFPHAIACVAVHGIAQVVHFCHCDQSFRRRINLADVLIPNINDALFGNLTGGVGDGLVFRVSDAMANAPRRLGHMTMAG